MPTTVSIPGTPRAAFRQTVEPKTTSCRPVGATPARGPALHVEYRVERDAGRGSALTQRTRKRFRPEPHPRAIRKLNFDAGHRLGNKRRLLESCERSAPPLVGGAAPSRSANRGEVCLERPLGFAECAVVAAGIVQRQKLTDDKAVGPAVPQQELPC